MSSGLFPGVFPGLLSGLFPDPSSGLSQDLSPGFGWGVVPVPADGRGIRLMSEIFFVARSDCTLRYVYVP